MNLLREHDAPPSTGGTVAGEPQHRITHWTNKFFGAKLGIRDLCAMAKDLGAGIDLPPQEDWAAIQAAKVTIGSVIADMGKDAAGEQIAPFAVGFNDPKHAALVREKTIAALEAAAKAGIKHMVVFTGMDTKEDRQVQFDRIVQGFTQKPENGESLMEIAERCGVTMDMEMLNTEGDPTTWRGHPGYLGNNMDEVAEVVRKIREISGSNRLGLLFDLYHVRMMKGDIRTEADKHHDIITYIHTAGVQLDPEGKPAANTRGPLTEPGQTIDFAEEIGYLRKLFKDKGMPLPPILQEFISQKTNPVEVIQEVRAAMALCMSRSPDQTGS